tara:strand:- start:5440 stop:5868 length:429 start_codon:yes stop_codon:yes gene_type:complete
MIIGLNHTGFVVSNLEESAKFYQDVIGLDLADSFERQGPKMSQVIGYPNAHLKINMFDLGSNHMLELIEYVYPEPYQRPTEHRSVIGGSHIAFTVENIYETWSDLKLKGVKPLNPPLEVVDGKFACYVQDPDGNWVELIEYK